MYSVGQTVITTKIRIHKFEQWFKKSRRGEINRICGNVVKIRFEDELPDCSYECQVFKGEIRPDYQIGDIVVNTHKSCAKKLAVKITKLTSEYVYYDRPNNPRCSVVFKNVRLANPEEIETYKKATDIHICDHCGKEMGELYYEDWNLILCHECYTKEKGRQTKKKRKYAKAYGGSTKEELLPVGQRVECCSKDKTEDEELKKWFQKKKRFGIVISNDGGFGIFMYKVKMDEPSPIVTDGDELWFEKNEVEAISAGAAIAHHIDEKILGEKVMKVGQRVECLKVNSSEASEKWIKDTHPKGIICKILDDDDNNYDYRVKFDDESPYGSKRLNFKKDEIRAVDANIIASEPFVSATPEELSKAQERLIGQYATWGQGGYAYRVLDVYTGHFEYDLGDCYHLSSGEHNKSEQINHSDMRLDVENLRIVDVTSYSKVEDQKEFYNEKLGIPFNDADTCSMEELQAAEEIYDKLKLSAASAIVEKSIAYKKGDFIFSYECGRILKITSVKDKFIRVQNNIEFFHTDIRIATQAEIDFYHKSQGWTINEDGSRSRIIESDDKPPSFDVSCRMGD